MSIGRYGECHKELEDEETVIYSYRVEGWGLPDEVRSEVEQVEGMFTIQKSALEGMFTIQKSALEEPEIRIERRKISAHRKGFVEKRVPRCPDISAHIEAGEVTVDKLCGIDAMEREAGGHGSWAEGLIFRVFVLYMINGELPEEDGFLN
ncbi:hypothetical protein [Tractidigestivibacter montrealensis]|uniref:Uncharacterized protein n=1 Tax=Tractidigestivibacter montrealensis TaxID=2972466 RepID=A0ABT1ZAZ2_9ACTN|nr:hypothetical protein [Tractidigestivibacter montrealensis]MCR9037372.1 hypothetical protein [Tractidigestivibacter montrealensis]